MSAGSAQWWAYRPVWVAVYFIVMMLCLPLFLWMEKKLGGGSSKHNTGFAVIIFGLAMCAGLAILAGLGVTGKGALGLNWLAIFMPILGVSALSLIGKRLPLTQT
jgi:hypothetical protein